MGNGSTIVPGDVQRMSARTGVRPIEFNENQSGTTRLIASSDAAQGSVKIHPDARMHAGLFDGEERARHEVRGRRAMCTSRDAP